MRHHSTTQHFSERHKKPTFLCRAVPTAHFNGLCYCTCLPRINTIFEKQPLLKGQGRGQKVKVGVRRARTAMKLTGKRNVKMASLNLAARHLTTVGPLIVSRPLFQVFFLGGMSSGYLCHWNRTGLRTMDKLKQVLYCCSVVIRTSARRSNRYAIALHVNININKYVIASRKSPKLYHIELCDFIRQMIHLISIRKLFHYETVR